MKALLQAGVAVAICAGVAGCATPGSSPDRTATIALSGTKAISTRDIDAFTVGKSTKADVLAALGKTTSISFDSGFEIWVYQYLGDAVAAESVSKTDPAERFERVSPANRKAGRTEFVVLFAPSGLVIKTRVRPDPQASPGPARNAELIAP